MGARQWRFASSAFAGVEHRVQHDYHKVRWTGCSISAYSCENSANYPHPRNNSQANNDHNNQSTTRQQKTAASHIHQPHTSRFLSFHLSLSLTPPHSFPKRKRKPLNHNEPSTRFSSACCPRCPRCRFCLQEQRWRRLQGQEQASHCQDVKHCCRKRCVVLCRFVVQCSAPVPCM